MRTVRVWIFSALLTMLAGGVVATEDKARAIDANGLKQALEGQAAVWLVDIRAHEMFEQSRIPGATHLPVGGIAAVDVPVDKKIVIYDIGLGSHGARDAARALMQRGARDVAILTGGVAAWRLANLPVEGALASVRNAQVWEVAADDVIDALADEQPMLLVDVRGASEYGRRHVGGAIHVMPHQLDERHSTWNKAGWIVLYDSGHGTARPLAGKLVDGGFQRVAYVRGGFNTLAARADRLARSTLMTQRQ